VWLLIEPICSLRTVLIAISAGLRSLWCLKVPLGLHIFHRARRALLLVFMGTTLILVMARRKIESGCGMRDRLTNDVRAHFTTCNLQLEILILQAYHMQHTHIKSSQDQSKGAHQLAAPRFWRIFGHEQLVVELCS
jgi:hypothetical protein